MFFCTHCGLVTIEKHYRCPECETLVRPKWLQTVGREEEEQRIDREVEILEPNWRLNEHDIL